ncbi:DUF6998 domain-containing protein [Nocardia asteroides]|uniref:DUF6998 domain-containing protein n=1 Tax=Nocardia asteroides TaxID=1824 RepID=UPI00379D740A
MDTDLAALTAPELLRLWAESMTELQARGLLRTSNNPVGDLAEAIAHEHFGGERGSFSQKGWDIRTTAGERIQVKGMRRTPGSKRTALSAIRDTDYDTVLVIIFDVNYELVEAFSMTREKAEAAFTHSSHVNGIIPRITQKLLMGEQVTRVDLRDAYRRISFPRRSADGS